MKRERDMDQIRSLMLEMEGGKDAFEVISGDTMAALGIDPEGPVLSAEEAERLEMHLTLLEEAGFAEFMKTGGGAWYVERITWTGHDFLSAVKDPDIWGRTKAGAAKVGGFTADTLLALAKGFIKQKLQKHTGVEVDL